MLLKRTVNGDIVKGIYKSSNILVSEYNQANNNLTVVFKYGGMYKYTDVPKTDFTRFEMADSQGQVLNSHIKKYAFENLGKVDTKALLESVEEAVKENLKDFQGPIISAFKGMSDDWDKDGAFDDAKLKKVKEFIKNYEDKLTE